MMELDELTTEDIVTLIKTEVMFFTTGFDTKEDEFDAVHEIANGLDCIVNRMEHTNKSLSRLTRRCDELVHERNELKMKLAEIRKAAE